MALLDEPASRIAVISLESMGGRYPSVAQRHPPAMRLERAARDLFGIEPTGLPDRRPWLDHNRWGVCHPLGDQSEPMAQRPPYGFLPVEGERLHQLQVGPVHASIIGPGHFRFTARGATVVRLAERLGSVLKGNEGKRKRAG